MFDIGWTEFLVIAVVALIAIGPKELPGVLRMVGQWMGKIRRMASDFQSQFNEAMREAEMEDIKKQVDDMTSAASSVTSFDPIGDISKEFETAIEDKPKNETKTDTLAEPQVATAPPAPELPAPAEPAPVAQDNASAPPTPDEPDAVRAPQPKVGSGA
jgi:sec-independent protein translocase protein TatB